MTTAQAGTSTSTRSGAKTTQQRGGGRARGTTINLPFVTAEFHGLDAATRAQLTATAAIVRAQLTREKMIFYGGLALGAVLDLLDWPVALAIGVSYELVGRGTRTKQP